MQIPFDEFIIQIDGQKLWAYGTVDVDYDFEGPDYSVGILHTHAFIEGFSDFCLNIVADDDGNDVILNPEQFDSAKNQILSKIDEDYLNHFI